MRKPKSNGIFIRNGARFVSGHRHEAEKETIMLFEHSIFFIAASKKKQLENKRNIYKKFNVTKIEK